MAIINSGCISFDRHYYKNGVVLIYFKENTTLENATVFIEKYNCSIRTIIVKEPIYKRGEYLTIEVNVPKGEEEEYIRIFEEQSIVHHCSLNLNG